MNCLKVYVQLMRKAQTRKTKLEVYEKHHVFPKSIYGQNNYVVKLTPREHHVAHALLCKGFIQRYGERNNKSIKMMHAFRCMHITNQSKSNGSRLYDLMRRKFVEMQSGELHPLFGRERTEETKLKIGRANRGRLVGDKNPMFGKFGSDHPRFGQTHTKEAKDKIGASRVGERHPLFGYTGDKNPFFGRSHTEETKVSISVKMSERNRGRRWWTNGFEDKFSRECPEGYWNGRSSTRKKE